MTATRSCDETNSTEVVWVMFRCLCLFPIARRGEADNGSLRGRGPDGTAETLHGSGGWDAGVRWFWSRHGDRIDATLGLGYTWLDPSGSFLGLERADTAHFIIDLKRSIRSRTALHLAARFDTSPLAYVTKTNLADPVLYYRFGAIVLTGPGHWLAFDLGEEIAPQIGVDADFSLHLSWGWKMGVP